MPTFVALLRGVNVGKAKRVPMADLRALLSGLGYTGVGTLLNSGNVVFHTPRGTAAKHSADIAAQLKVEVPVIVKSASELAAIISENPIEVGRNCIHAFWLHSFKIRERCRASRPSSLWLLPEQFAVGVNAAYLLCAAGILESKAGLALLGMAGKLATTRIWATVLKLKALVNGADA